MEVGDDLCEHTVFLAINECGLVYLEASYRDRFLAVAERLLRDSGELKADESPDAGDGFPAHIIPEMVSAFENDGVEYRDAYGIPPAGLAVYAGFVEAPE